MQRAEGDDRNIARRAVDLMDGLDAFGIGQRQVEQQEIERLLREVSFAARQRRRRRYRELRIAA
jgi:hypothetical protein